MDYLVYSGEVSNMAYTRQSPRAFKLRSKPERRSDIKDVSGYAGIIGPESRKPLDISCAIQRSAHK